MKEKILVVEDDKSISDLLNIYLSNENFEVHCVKSSEEAVKYIKIIKFDLAILDIMLPEKDGFYLSVKIREKYNYPIIMLTAKTDENSKITGLTLGADDYITKPFLPLELVARVKAQIRRYKKYNNLSNKQVHNKMLLAYSNLQLNIKSRECTLKDKMILLTPSEFTILKCLLERKGEVVSSEELFCKICPDDEYYIKNNNTITVHIRHLREKLGDKAGESKYIKTVWGVGYKIV